MSMGSTELGTAIELLARAVCPDCDGSGGVQRSVMTEECCHGSDWECGAEGCTGPVPVEDIEVEQCHWCGHRDALIDTHSKQAHGARG